MAGSFIWRTGIDGTQYYVNTANGSVAGMVASAGNGADIYKIGRGTDFFALFQGEANAKAAVEKTAGLAELKAAPTPVAQALKAGVPAAAKTPPAAKKTVPAKKPAAKKK